jgi:chorismate mutase
MISDEYTQKMKKLRANIDVLDATLLELLGKRKVADEIGGGRKGQCCGIAKTDGTRY